MSTAVAQRLAEIGLTIPSVVPPLAAYVPAIAHESLVVTAGQLPIADGELTCTGRLGADVDVEAGQAAAKLCALNAIAAIASVADLDRVAQVLKVVGFVASTPDFTDQPAVINGASDLLRTAFGEAGRHARSAVGVSALPLGAAVEVEVMVALR